MKRIFYRTLLVFVSALLLIISFFNYKGYIHFGHGILDFFPSLLLLVIVVALIFFLSIHLDRKNSENINSVEKIWLLISLASLLITILFITVFRGPMSPWNGEIFFF